MGFKVVENLVLLVYLELGSKPLLPPSGAGHNGGECARRCVTLYQCSRPFRF